MGTVVLFLMQVLEILVQTAMLRCGVRLRVKVFVYVVEVMMEPPTSTGPQAGRQQGGQWEADQERFLEHSKQSFLELDLHNSFLFVDFFQVSFPFWHRTSKAGAGRASAGGEALGTRVPS